MRWGGISDNSGPAVGVVQVPLERQQQVQPPNLPRAAPSNPTSFASSPAVAKGHQQTVFLTQYLKRTAFLSPPPSLSAIPDNNLLRSIPLDAAC